MTEFKKPSENNCYVEMGSEAIRSALKDSGVDQKDIECAFAS